MTIPWHVTARVYIYVEARVSTRRRTARSPSSDGRG